MKKTLSIISILLVTALLTVSCTKVEADDAMVDETMVDDTMVDDAMVNETMVDDKMADDAMADDTMTDDAMADDAMADEHSEDDMSVETMMNEGSAAPSFELMDTEGNTHTLADYAGKKVYIKVWASWCSICLSGLEEVDTLAGMEEDFVVLTVVTPDYKGEKSVDEFKEWFSGIDTMNMTVLLDQDGAFAQELGVRGYPTSAYIGSDGVLVQVLPGHADNAAIIEKFDSIY